MDINLNNVQHEPIVVTGNITAALNRYYVNTANATYTDPTPANGEGFIVFVRNGIATIGGTTYSNAGTIVYRYYHSGSWVSYEKSSEIIVQTAAQWAADTTVYSNKRILITSDVFYGNSDQRKFKIADGTQTWSNLDYFGSQFDSLIIKDTEATGSIAQFLNSSDVSQMDVGDGAITVNPNADGSFELGGDLYGSIGTTINLTGSTNNLSIGNSVFVILTSTGAQDLTGISAPQGKIICLYNADTADIITLKNNSASSSASNRFDFFPASDFALNPKQMVFLANINAKWRLLSSGASGSSGITSLNALTGSTQTFSTGTSGSDFNISSSGTIHTFNLPTASSSVRGVLFPADWTTFNNKLSSGDLFFNHISGLWSAPLSAGAINSGTSFDARTYYMPIVISRTTTFTAIGVPISVGVASSTCRLAIYNSSPTTGEPTTVVYETATLDTSTNGFKSETFGTAQTLTRGLYWLGFQVSSASVGVRFTTSVIVRPNPANSVAQTNYIETKTYGAFTSNPTVTFTNNTNSVMVMLRAQ